MLICGENTNPLARFALMAEGEQVHISSYPPVWPTRPPEGPGNYDLAQAIRIRAGAHAFEAKVFNLVASSASTIHCGTRSKGPSAGSRCGSWSSRPEGSRWCSIRPARPWETSSAGRRASSTLRSICAKRRTEAIPRCGRLLQPLRYFALTVNRSAHARRRLSTSAILSGQETSPWSSTARHCGSEPADCLGFGRRSVPGRSVILSPRLPRSLESLISGRLTRHFELERLAAFERWPGEWHPARSGLPFPSFQDTLSECVIQPGGLNVRGGKDRDSFTSRRPQQLAPPTPTWLLACTIALAVLSSGMVTLGGGHGPFVHFAVAQHPSPGRAPYLSIQSTLKPKVCPSRLRPPSLHPKADGT